MNYKLHKLLFFVVLAVGGCKSKGFNRGELQDQIGVVAPKYDDNDIKAVFAKKANLPKSFRLAVFFKSPDASIKKDDNWRWSEDDRAVIDQALANLKKDGITSDVFPILNSMVSSEDMKSIRLAAARHHADVVLIIGGAGQIDRYINNWGWSYALILPAFFVPGSESRTLFITNATLWDVRNEYLYLTAEAESITPENYIAAFGKRDQELLELTKTDAVKKLSTELSSMIKGSKL